MSTSPKSHNAEIRAQLQRAIDTLKRFTYNTRSELNAPLMLAEFISSSSTKEMSDYGQTIQQALSNVADLLDQFEAQMKEILIGKPLTKNPFNSEVRLVQTPPPSNVQANQNINVKPNNKPELGHILVVEDNPVSQTLVKKILEKKGYSVEIAVSGEDALLAANRGKFSLILMDISLPGIDGFETTRLIKENYHTENIPIIALSAHSNTEVKISASEAGMVGFISKPVDTNSLLRAIKSVTE